MTLSSSNKNKILYVFTLFVVVMTMMFYNQYYDMAVTSLHSHDFLDLTLSGKAGSFYDFVLQKATADGYFGNGVMDAAIYNPVLYILIAILILPIYLINRIGGVGADPRLYCEYLRVLMVGVTIWTAFRIGKIYDDNQKERMAIFITSPILIISVVIANQIDVVAALISVYALREYKRGDNRKFIILTAISLFIKPFAIIAFIPLMLLREKNIIRLARNIGCVVLPLGLVTVLCKLLPGYTLTQSLMGDEYSFGDRLFSSNIQGGMSNISVFVVLYAVVCVAAYLMRDESKAILIGFIAFVIFVAFVPFHIQWLVHMMPYLTLALTQSKDKYMTYIMDIGFEAFFVLFMAVYRPAIFFFRYSIMGNAVSLEGDSLAKLVQYRIKYDSPDVVFSLMIGFMLALIISLLYDKYYQKTQERDVGMGFICLRSSLILIYVVPTIFGFFMIG